MEDQQINQTQEHNTSSSTISPAAGPGKQETVRSRWTPKPEQILILESIFNSGTVNPPKDEAARIRKLLEKFGSVGDANVFYWFQNRRSRSRRRQRQIQASLAGGDPQRQQQHQQQIMSNTTLGLEGDHLCYSAGTSAGFNISGFGAASGGGEFVYGSSSCGSYNGGDHGGGGGDHSMFAGSAAQHQMGLLDIDSSSFLYPSDLSSMHFRSDKNHSNLTWRVRINYIDFGCNFSCATLCDDDCLDNLERVEKIDSKTSQIVKTTNFRVGRPTFFGVGYITVFINGVATEVPRGQIDMKAVFGEDVMLIHSSGLAVPFNEFGFSLQSLNHGETYFLVSRTG